MERPFNKEADVRVLVDKLRRSFEGKGYDCKLVSGDILEIKRTSGPRKLSGLSAGVRVAITVRRGQTIVNLSGHVEEYMLKGAVIAAGLVFMILFPLAASGGYGMYVQYNLMKQVMEEIDDYFNDLIVEQGAPRVPT